MVVIASNVLAAGLQTTFADTYAKIRNRQADSRLAMLMDLGVSTTTRNTTFGYINAAPHMELWRRGDTIPTDGMGSVNFSVPVYTWGRRVEWHSDDRKDDQTQSLMQLAQMAGASAALLPECMFIDLITAGSTIMPAVPTAPDGAVMFATTDGASAARFGVTYGNLLSGNGVASASAIRTDYYNCIEQWKQFQDGKGQPLLAEEIIDAGVVIIHAAEYTEAFEEAFLQKRQGWLGPDNTTDAVTGVSVTNLVQDASRQVTLWGTSRISGADWYVFLKNPPTQPTFYLTREGVIESSSMESSDNGDRTRDTGIEYVQWKLRSGAGIALPYGAIKVNN